MTTLETIDRTVHKTNTIINDIATAQPKLADKEHAHDALRAVLTTLRDRLTPEQANSLGAQLTPLLRGMFYEGWKLGSVPVKMNKEEFLEAVESRLSTPFAGATEELVRDVLATVAASIDPKELDKLKHGLPEDVIDLLPA